MKTGTALAIALFSLVALAHLLRLLMSVEVVIENWLVPQWLSVPAVIVPAGIAILLFKESQNERERS